MQANGALLVVILPVTLPPDLCVQFSIRNCSRVVALIDDLAFLHTFWSYPFDKLSSHDYAHIFLV